MSPSAYHTYVFESKGLSRLGVQTQKTIAKRRLTHSPALCFQYSVKNPAGKTEDKPSRSRLGRMLHLREAAIDEQLDAGHVAAVIRSQEYNSFGDLIGFTQAPHGHGGADA